MTPALAPLTPNEAIALFTRTRARSDALAAPLSPEDTMLQSMEDASPVKWHLAHTTWFFEEFILKPRVPDYRSPDDRFAFLFNSYYTQAGPRHARDKRGLVSRPGGQAVRDYRAHVEDSLATLLMQRREDGDEIAGLVELGCHHEMQHQELLVTDLLHGLSFNPLLPVYKEPEPLEVTAGTELRFDSHEGGLVEIGHDGAGFAYDCEGPRHKTFLSPYEIANRPVTNRDWIGFIEDGGYGDVITNVAAADAETVLRAGLPRIQFAFSELSPSFPGYVEGAIVAGRASAERVTWVHCRAERASSIVAGSGGAVPDRARRDQARISKS